MKEVIDIPEPSTAVTLNFVDRTEEMNRIHDALNAAKDGRGQLLVIRGEAGSGKTRLMQESAVEAEKHGFFVGFGTARSESVMPYHPWKEVLEGLDLASILDEHPPPKLIGMYLVTSDGQIKARVERKGIDREIVSDLTHRLEETSRDSKTQKGVVDGGISIQSRDNHRLLLRWGSTVHLGAMIEGREDEAFLTDMMELADKADSMFSGKSSPYKEENPQQAALAQMQQLLDSEIYEGIDYSRGDPKLRQAKLFEQVTLGLCRKTRTRSLCVAIDDLQWADPSSLALLNYVARNTVKKGVLLVGSYRIEEVETRPHLKDALKNMRQEELLDEMDLKGLSKKDIPDLAKAFIGAHDLQDDFLDSLWRETQGNPLFVREMLKELEEEGAITVHGAVKRLVRPLDQLAISERVREVIRARLKRLPGGDRRLLDAAATCGTRFTAALVAKVAGEEETKVLNGLSAIAKVHGLLRPVDSSFTFDHPAVQEVLYDGVPVETRRNYHRDAAEWLELAGGPIEEIAEQYYRARDNRAAKKLQEAALLASSKYANEVACRLLDEALDIALPEDHETLLELSGDALCASARFNEGLKSYERVLDLVESKSKIAEIRGKIGSVYLRKGNYNESAAQCAQALSLVHNEGGKEEADVLHRLGSAYLYLGAYEKSYDCLARSLKISENLNDLRGIAKTNDALGCVYSDQGRYENALECIRKGLALFEEIGDLRGAAGAFNNLGTVYRDQGNYESALECFESSIKISKQTGDRPGLALFLSNCSEICYRQGCFEKAFDYLIQSLGISEKIGDKVGIASIQMNIGNLHTIREDWENALTAYRRCIELLERTGYQGNIASALNNIGIVYLRQGEYEKSLESYEKSLGISEGMGERKLTAELYSNLAEVHLARDDVQEALKFCQRALSLSTEIGQKYQIGASRRVLGLIYCKCRKWDESIENFELGIQIHREMGGLLDEADLHFEFGLMWKQKGDKTRANEQLMKAVELFEALKLTKRVAKARKMLDAGAQ